MLMHRGLYEAGMKTFSQMDMNNYCNRFMKENMPFLRNVDKFALTNSIYNAFAAFKNFFKGIGKYFKDTKGELKKVVWPTASTTAKNTGTVLLCSLAVGACIWIFDGVAMLLIKTLIGAFTG